jgi:hypothetical protein
MVLMSVYHQVYARVVESFPQLGNEGVTGPAECIRREETGAVPKGYRADLGVGSQIGLQPLILSRSFLEADGIVHVEHNHVPVPQVEAVVPQLARTGSGAEVVERRGGGTQVVFVIS